MKENFSAVHWMSEKLGSLSVLFPMGRRLLLSCFRLFFSTISFQGKGICLKMALRHCPEPAFRLPFPVNAVVYLYVVAPHPSLYCYTGDG